MYIYILYIYIYIYVCVSICVCMCSKVIFPIHKIVNRCAMSQIAHEATQPFSPLRSLLAQ